MTSWTKILLYMLLMFCWRNKRYKIITNVFLLHYSTPLSPNFTFS